MAVQSAAVQSRGCVNVAALSLVGWNINRTTPSAGTVNELGFRPFHELVHAYSFPLVTEHEATIDVPAGSPSNRQSQNESATPLTLVNVRTPSDMEPDAMLCLIDGCEPFAVNPGFGNRFIATTFPSCDRVLALAFAVPFQ